MACARNGRAASFGQVERLQHELAHLPLALAAHVLRAREVEPLLGAGHADVEEAPLLLLVEVAGGQRVLDQLGRQLERIGAPGGREPVLHAVHHEHDRPLEPLGLVHGEHVHRGRLGVRLGHRRIVARVDQRVQVVHELAHVVVLEHPRRVLDPA